jgi:methylmalonyl-CoA mutase cobalamin-binding subunit
MLTKERIRSLFAQLNNLLRERGEIGEIGIVGGAVMCLVYNTRAATKDVDAVFEPSSVIRELASQIAKGEELPPD